MNRNREPIRQSATVIRVDQTGIEVEVCRPEACAACRARNVCSELGVSEEGGRRMTLVNDGQGYAVGEQVTLVMRRAAGFKAVIIAYFIPVCLIVAALLIFQQTGVRETVAGVVTLGIVGIYYLVVRLFRQKLRGEMTIQIEKKSNDN
ncbi:SoxR reducing system RseC family protein [uncultured Rikenella sp.]|uniref:SoxR reducing system RseC family protein n=1 Tax=uncultured Rikenella sp. TaxID=368003 RepID=UPI0025F73C92|nr:SoxR reducing system RseC family protein [uncultured Rikenella sp.]